MTIIAMFVVLLLTVSANTDRQFNAVEGSKAPAIEVKASNGTTVSPLDKQGRFVIVNFWASGDAGSRIAANRYEQYVESTGDERIGLVSVNFDDNEKLFREIVRRDGLKNESQFNVEPQQKSEVIRRYSLENGLKSFLLDRDGVIVAVNPTIEQTASLLN